MTYIPTTAGVGVHALGGSAHSADTLADLNTKISDATLTPELALTAVKVGSFTALLNDRVLLDPTAGSLTFDAPASPSTGDKWGFKNVTTDITAFTIDGNGNNIESPFSSSFVASYSTAANGALMSFVYFFDGTNWIIV